MTVTRRRRRLSGGREAAAEGIAVEAGQRVDEAHVVRMRDFAPPETRERLRPYGSSKSNYQFHLRRYHFAAEVLAAALGERVSSARILDVACGVGYGSNLLAKLKPQSVVGVDIDPAALRWANRKYAREEIPGSTLRRDLRDNLSFLRMDASKLALPDKSFDAVVSFETIEHVPDGKVLVDNVGRVLESGGVFICSSPNPEATPQIGGRPENPHHVKEFTMDELRELLEPGFDDIRFYGQGELRAGAAGDARRAVINTIMRFDRLNLRRFLPEWLKNAARKDIYGKDVIKPVEELSGKPAVWIAVCRRKTLD